MKKPYYKPAIQLLPAFHSRFMAGSVRNDGHTIIPDGTDPDEFEEDLGDDANSKENPWGLWNCDLWREETTNY